MPSSSHSCASSARLSTSLAAKAALFTQLAHSPSAREWHLGRFWHAGQPRASGSAATQQPWHSVPLACFARFVHPSTWHSERTRRLPPSFGQCVSSKDWVGWSHSTHLRKILPPEITPRNPFFASHARRSASVLGGMVFSLLFLGHKSQVCKKITRHTRTTPRDTRAHTGTLKVGLERKFVGHDVVGAVVLGDA